MSHIIIDISDNATVNISVDGVVVGLVSALHVRAVAEEALPVVEVSLVDVHELSDAASREKLVASLNMNMDVLKRNPHVRIVPHGTIKTNEE